MASDNLTINFGKPIPLFPLHQCLLLPHAHVPLHIFEDRYKAMVHAALDSNGLIAMAIFKGDAWKHDYENTPPIRPTVCVGYVSRHESLPDGRYNILLQGVCRARIVEEFAPEASGYRTALLRPTDIQPKVLPIDEAAGNPDPDDPELTDARARLNALLDDEHLRRLASISAIHNWLNDSIPTHVMIDLAAMTLASDSDARYASLAQSDVLRRARMVERQLVHMRDLVERAQPYVSTHIRDGWPVN